MQKGRLEFRQALHPDEILKSKVKASQDEIKGEDKSPRNPFGGMVFEHKKRKLSKEDEERIRSDKERTEKRKEYGRLLHQHQKLTELVRILSDQQERIPSESRQKNLDKKDGERHGIHLALLEYAKSFGKNHADVTADLLLLEGSTRELGLEIPMIEPRHHSEPGDCDDLLQLIRLQRSPDFLDIAQMSRDLEMHEDWNQAEAVALVETLGKHIDVFLKKNGEVHRTKTGWSVWDTLRHVSKQIADVKNAADGFNSLKTGRSDILSLGYIPEHIENLQEISLPDEVVLIFGVQSTPEAYRVDGEAPNETMIHMEPIDNRETFLKKHEMNDPGRENMWLFSAGYEERMLELQNIIEDEPHVRGWASGMPDGHDQERLVGLAVRKKFLQAVINKIRSNPERYWKHVDGRSGRAYMAGHSSEGGKTFYSLTDIASGKESRYSAIPEVRAIPKMLQDQFSLNIIAYDDLHIEDDGEYAQKQIEGFYTKEAERLWTIANA